MCIRDRRLPVSDPAPLSGRAGAGPAVAVSTNGVSDPAVADMELVRTPPAGAFDARPVETVLAALPPLEPPADRERMRSPAPPDGRTAFAAAEAARPRSRGAAELKQQEALVLALLQEYTRAYERMDVQAAKAVWPTLDTRALQRAFQQLEAQRVRFARCQIDFMSQHEANAHCRGDYAFTPRVGNRREQLVPREWTFNLAQAEDRWRIVDVNAAYH